MSAIPPWNIDRTLPQPCWTRAYICQRSYPAAHSPRRGRCRLVYGEFFCFVFFVFLIRHHHHILADITQAIKTVPSTTDSLSLSFPTVPPTACFEARSLRRWHTEILGSRVLSVIAITKSLGQLIVKTLYKSIAYTK